MYFLYSLFKMKKRIFEKEFTENKRKRLRQQKTTNSQKFCV